jgi:hypothetical protein
MHVHLNPRSCVEITPLTTVSGCYAIRDHPPPTQILLNCPKKLTILPAMKPIIALFVFLLIVSHPMPGHAQEPAISPGDVARLSDE